MEIYFKDTVVNIHEYFLQFQQICKITEAKDSTMGEKRGNMEKNFLNPEKFPQTASGRLDLFSCLCVWRVSGGCVEWNVS